MSPVKSICRSVSGREALCAFFLLRPHSLSRDAIVPRPPSPLFVFFMGFLRRFLSHISAVTSARPAFTTEASGRHTLVSGLLPTDCLASDAFRNLLLKQPKRPQRPERSQWEKFFGDSGRSGVAQEVFRVVLVSNVCFWRDSRMNGVLDYLEF